MRGDWYWGVDKRSWIALLVGACAGLTAPVARAADCPGHPDALGISRVLVVDPREHPRIGAMQYKETLPLRDHEVVLTFDDGPVPKYSNQVLQILADQCLKATFFTIGRQAQASPEGVRKLAAAGHTIGTHSQTHPLTFNKMSLDQVRPEVDQGIASVTAALNDPAQLAPFFRAPGLLRSEAVEDYVGSLGIQMWSADFLADDWRKISSAKVYELAIKRIEARGRGILLLHDIHQRTVQALPNILHELKARGYHIVQVVPATPDRPATPTEPEDWLVHRASDNVAGAHWPAIPPFNFGSSTTRLNAVSADFSLLSAGPFTTPQAARETAWPPVTRLATRQTASELPVPAADLFEIQAPMAPALARHDALPARPLKPAAKAARRAVRMASLRKR